MPDEVGRSAKRRATVPTKPIILDAGDDLARFVREVSAWVNKDGMPLSWRHYVLGLRHLDKARARLSLDMYRASAVAQSYGQERDDWIDEQENLAGF